MRKAACMAMAMALCVSAISGGPDDKEKVGRPAAGPRGLVGPDVPLTDAENKQLARRVAVELRTAEGVQAACQRAVKEGTGVVFLPAGQYVFEKQVRVAGGLTLLGEGSKTLCQAKGKDVHLFGVQGNGVRFTRLKLQGADTTSSGEG